MIIAPVADIKAKFSAYLKACETGPVVVTRNGKAVAVLLSVTDDEDVERLLLSNSPKFQALLKKARAQIDQGMGIPHDEFWEKCKRGPRNPSSPAGEQLAGALERQPGPSADPASQLYRSARYYAWLTGAARPHGCFLPGRSAVAKLEAARRSQRGLASMKDDDDR